jgi:hypothetical protein
MSKIHNNLTIENLIKTDWFNQFNKEQQKQILLGLESKVDVLVYAKLEYNSFKMLTERIKLELGVDISYMNELLEIQKKCLIKYKKTEKG